MRGVGLVLHVVAFDSMRSVIQREDQFPTELVLAIACRSLQFYCAYADPHFAAALRSERLRALFSVAVLSLCNIPCFSLGFSSRTSRTASR